MRKSGDYTLEELTSDIDGSLAYQVPETGQDAAIAGSWEASQVDLDPNIEWVCDDLEDDDLEISMTVEAYAALVKLAAVGRRYAGCSVCERVTRV